MRSEDMDWIEAAEVVGFPTTSGCACVETVPERDVMLRTRTESPDGRLSFHVLELAPEAARRLAAELVACAELVVARGVMRE